MEFSVIRNSAFRNDLNLRKEILNLIRPSYEDPTALLKREIEQCDTLYLARDDDSRLVSFFLVAWQALPFENTDLPAVYLGLSGTTEDTKNSGTVRTLYMRFLSEGALWEEENHRRLLLWTTAATPSTCFVIHNLFAEAEPYTDGSYSSWGASVANAIRRKRGISPSDSSSHPFVLSQVAHNTLYSQKEVERINRITEKKNFTLLKDLGVDERKGDRLLFICRVPPNLLNEE